MVLMSLKATEVFLQYSLKQWHAASHSISIHYSENKSTLSFICHLNLITGHVLKRLCFYANFS